ncbi:unnamed protein product [Durusdinium trenchii]|uniref:EF-hand domain-containing protein n=1 Tax=Durusdinium trenchii TaxID=1381693 RepID=A0ABP0H8U7_9DINO
MGDRRDGLLHEIFHVLDQKQRGFVSKVELSHILDAMQADAGGGRLPIPEGLSPRKIQRDCRVNLQDMSGWLEELSVTDLEDVKWFAESVVKVETELRDLWADALRRWRDDLLLLQSRDLHRYLFTSQPPRVARWLRLRDQTPGLGFTQHEVETLFAANTAEEINGYHQEMQPFLNALDLRRQLEFSGSPAEQLASLKDLQSLAVTPELASLLIHEDTLGVATKITGKQSVHFTNEVMAEASLLVMTLLSHNFHLSCEHPKCQNVLSSFLEIGYDPDRPPELPKAPPVTSPRSRASIGGGRSSLPVPVVPATISTWVKNLVTAEVDLDRGDMVDKLIKYDEQRLAQENGAVAESLFSHGRTIPVLLGRLNLTSHYTLHERRTPLRTHLLKFLLNILSSSGERGRRLFRSATGMQTLSAVLRGDSWGEPREERPLGEEDPTDEAEPEWEGLHRPSKYYPGDFVDDKFYGPKDRELAAAFLEYLGSEEVWGEDRLMEEFLHCSQLLEVLCRVPSCRTLLRKQGAGRDFGSSEAPRLARSRLLESRADAKGQYRVISDVELEAGAPQSPEEFYDEILHSVGFNLDAQHGTGPSQLFISGLIVANAVVIGMETDNKDDELWSILEFVFLGIFTVELILRLIVSGPKKFFSYTTEDFSWTGAENLFDFCVVFAGCLDVMSNMSPVRHEKGSFMTFLRIVRLLRVMRMIRLLRFLRDFHVLTFGFAAAAVAIRPSPSLRNAPDDGTRQVGMEDLKDATQRIVHYGRSGRWPHVLAVFHQLGHRNAEPDVKCCNAVLSGCRDWSKAVAVLQEATQMRLKRDAVTLASLLRGRQGEWEKSFSTLSEAAKSEVSLDAVFYMNILASCSTARRWKESAHLLRHLGIKRHRYDQQHCNSVMASCDGRWELTCHLLKVEQQRSLQVDVIAVNSAIHACAADHDGHAWEQGVMILLGTAEMRVSPDIISFNTAMSACAHCQPQLVLLLLRRLCRHRCRPDVVTCSSLIAACSRSSLGHQSMKLMKSMRKRSIEINTYTYATAISACTDWQQAADLVVDVRARALPLAEPVMVSSISTCEGCWQHALQLPGMAIQGMLEQQLALALNAAMTVAGARNMWQISLHILESTQNHWLRPDVVRCNAAIGSCSRSSEWNTALQMFAQMKGLTNVVSKISALLACGHGGHWQGALWLLFGDRLNEVAEASTAFFTAANACADAGEWQRALEVVNAMLSQGPSARSTETMNASMLRLDGYSLNALVNAFARASLWARAIGPLTSSHADSIAFNSALCSMSTGKVWTRALATQQSMVQAALVADVVSFGSSITACENSHRWLWAIRLFSQMQFAGLKPGLITCSAAASALEKCGIWNGAGNLLSQMFLWEVQPSATTINAVIAASERVSQWLQALGFLSAMPLRFLSADLISVNSVVTACERQPMVDSSLQALLADCSASLECFLKERIRRPIGVSSKKGAGTPRDTMVSPFAMQEVGISAPGHGVTRDVLETDGLLAAFLIGFVVFVSFGMVGLLTGLVCESMFDKNDARVEQERAEAEEKRQRIIKNCEKIFETIASQGQATIEDIMQILPDLDNLFVEEGVTFAREDLVNTATWLPR